jgi:hypothetical protein
VYLGWKWGVGHRVRIRLCGGQGRDGQGMWVARLEDLCDTAEC